MGWFLRGQDTCDGFIEGEMEKLVECFFRGQDTCDSFIEGEISGMVFEGAGYVLWLY